LKVGDITASFNATDSICISDQYHPIDNSTATGGMSVTSWHWNFGDGHTIDSSSAPFHKYNSPGIKTVTLISGTNGGCHDTIQKQVYIHSIPTITTSATDTFACPMTPNVELNAQ